MNCPACGRCPFKGGVCEDRVNRGRRYFLMGALALPVARKIEALAPGPAAERVTIVWGGRELIWQRVSDARPEWVRVDGDLWMMAT